MLTEVKVGLLINFTDPGPKGYLYNLINYVEDNYSSQKVLASDQSSYTIEHPHTRTLKRFNLVTDIFVEEP